MVETVVLLLFGLALTWVAGIGILAFMQELRTSTWRSDFALGVASVIMLAVGLVIVVSALMYTVARL